MPSSTLQPSKRQNRSIASFFSPSSTSTINNPGLSASSLAPPLPAQLQADLLNVGMRVRKAMANGYSTKNTAFPPYLPPGVSATITGGYDIDNDPFASEPSSQESVPDNRVGWGKELKRGFNHEEDEAEEAGEREFGADTDEEDGIEIEVQERVQERRSAFDLLMSSRQLAVPKSQKKRDARKRNNHAAVARRGVMGGVDQVMMGAKGTGTKDDFEDAVFLRPVDEVDMEDI